MLSSIYTYLFYCGSRTCHQLFPDCCWTCECDFPNLNKLYKIKTFKALLFLYHKLITTWRSDHMGIINKNYSKLESIQTWGLSSKASPMSAAFPITTFITPLNHKNIKTSEDLNKTTLKDSYKLPKNNTRTNAIGAVRLKSSCINNGSILHLQCS